MNYYKGAIPGSDNFIYFKSEVKLYENDVIVLEEKKYFIERIESGLLILQKVGAIVSVSV
ncbi:MULTISPECIES: hypothetical protein [Paenibacillus]|uniref:Uncharacterized protein n=3 Tax=Paenibacillus TaxID=44249 RepID=G4HJY1_9BACL|nr:MULTISPECIES: hypothetical protein [Paenibacillus]ANY76291.1 hypothetical protein BBD41_29030 [Paenibacillus ihbetae]EHB62585.1 hypothetical protein PaelaDRAFT_4328 [Paenibacillus lactis 154]MBP1896838.1 hypothetical protein [Paenibacillus lactis]OOC61566.1 hypothetical protein BBD40_06635 [Paenibacillus ihbetae]GIO90383.1 hypothetical protein J31TS3_16100 [Paenibacillus lactis]